MKLTFIFLILSLCLAFSGCANLERVATSQEDVQTLTFLYVGGGEGAQKRKLEVIDYSKELINLIDFKAVPLSEIKPMLIKRVTESSLPVYQKLIVLARISKFQSDIISTPDINPNLRLTVSQFFKWSIEAAEML